MQFMHRRLLPEGKWRWYIQDIGYPLGAATVIIFLGRVLLGENRGAVVTGLIITATAVVAIISAILTIPWLRKMIFDTIILKKAKLSI
jgi:hypothetical protein